MKVGQITHGYEVLEFWDYTHFLKVVNNLNKVSRRKGWWIRMIRANKLVCPVTNLKVKYVSLDANKTYKDPTRATFHYNFYSECGKLFTVDHIIPRSKGGAINDVKNLQPMIAEKIWEKGSDLDYSHKVIQVGKTETLNEFKGTDLTKQVKPNQVLLYQKFSGANLFTKRVAFKELPLALIPESQKGTSPESIVEVKVSSNWAYDLSGGQLNIISNDSKTKERMIEVNSPDMITHIVESIKKGGSHSEDILRTFLANITTLNETGKE